MLRILLLLGTVWAASAHHGNECEHKNVQQNNAAEQNQLANVQPEVIQYYPEQSHVLTSRSVVETAPAFYYPEVDTAQVFIPVEALPEVVRIERQVFGEAANIPVSGGPFPLPAIQPARPINRPFRPLPFQVRPIRQLPQVEDPNAGVPRPVRPPTQPARPAVDPPRFSTQPSRPIGGAAKIPVSAGPFPLNQSGGDVQNPPANLPQIEDPNAGLEAAPPKTPLLKPVVLGPHPVDVPSWVTKPQVEDPKARIEVDKPKTKPFPVAGTNIGQPKPVLSSVDESRINSENVPQKQTRPFPVAGTDVGQPKPVGEFPKTKPFPVAGTNIGQPKPVLPSGESAAEQNAGAAGELLRSSEVQSKSDDLETKDTAFASPQRLTRPFPVPGSSIGLPSPVGSIGSTRPFPVVRADIGQPPPVQPSTRPFPVPGTNIGQPSAVGPVQAVAAGPFPLGRK